jgi:hypothetical protein
LKGFEVCLREENDEGKFEAFLQCEIREEERVEKVENSEKSEEKMRNPIYRV